MPLREFDDEQLDNLARAVAKALSDTRVPRTNWDRRLTLVIGALTVVSLIFTFGVNWSRISGVERQQEQSIHRLDRHEIEIREVRQEINSNTSQIQQQLGEIKAQLGAIQGQLSVIRK